MTSPFCWAALPLTRDLEPFGSKMLRSLRLVPHLRRNASSTAAKLVEELGDAATVRKFMLVAHAIGAVWPEPLAVCTPCGCMVTHDETLVLHLFAAAVREDRPAFDQYAHDLLDEAERNHLYIAMLNFIVHYERSALAPPAA